MSGTAGLSAAEYAKRHYREELKSLESMVGRPVDFCDQDTWNRCAEFNLQQHRSTEGTVSPWHKANRDPFTLDGFTTRDVLEGRVDQEKWGLWEADCYECGRGDRLFLAGNSQMGSLVCEDCRVSSLPGGRLELERIPLRRGARAEILGRAAHTIDCVYFVLGDGLVKIGKATDLYQRLAGVVTGSPVQLYLFATAGPARLEKEYHDLLSTKRDHHEWFNVAPEEALRLPGVFPVDGELLGGTP